MNKKDFIDLFPEAEHISDKSLMEKAYMIWQEALGKSEWDDVHKAIWNYRSEGYTLIAHTQAVLRMSMDMAKHIQENVKKNWW